MNCIDFEKQLEKYMDGELEQPLQSEWEQHLLGCAACNKKYAGYIELKKGFTSIKAVPPPASFHQQWTKAIYNQPENQTKKKNTFVHFLPAIASGVAAVAIFSVIVLSGVFQNTNTAQTEDLAVAAAYSTEQEMAAANPEIAGNGAEAAPQLSAASSKAPAAAAAPAEDAAVEEAAAAPEMAMKSVTESTAADTAALPLIVSQDVFNNLLQALDEYNFAFTQTDNHILFSVTDQNIETVISLFKEYVIELCPTAGASYDISYEA